MEQHQTRLAFTVGTKLLISIVVLLLVVILFLNISTIFIFKEDKRAYTYQTQSTEALVAGREFISLAKQSVATLRGILSTVDPRVPVGANEQSNLQSVLENQTDILSASLLLVNPTTGDAKRVATVNRSVSTGEVALKPNDFELSTDTLKRVMPSLLKNAYAMLNTSKQGGPLVLTVLFADLNLVKNPGGMPVAVGLVSLKAFSDHAQNLQITVANRSGGVLYDSDLVQFYARQALTENPLFMLANTSSVENGAMEFDANGIHYLGSYLNPGMDLTVLSKTEWRQAMRPAYNLIEKCIFLGMIAVGAAVIFAILFSKTLTAPIGRLYEATRQVAGGNFGLQVDEKGTDEISALSKSFNVMSRKILELIEESIQKTKLENEIAIASTVQQTLIPSSENSAEWFTIHSHYQPADQCGGDWWGYFNVGGKAVVMIADATGHGLPCALITASARSCFSVLQKLANEDSEFSFSPAAMLSFANRVVFDASQGSIMMTFFIAVIDSEKSTITFSNAGHYPAWLFRKIDGQRSLVSLGIPGERLGEKQENRSYEEASAEIKPGDILFLYTDGLTEGKNPEGGMYGKKAVRKAIEASLEQGAKSVVENVVQGFMTFSQGHPLEDDITIAAVTMTGEFNSQASNVQDTSKAL